MKRSVFDEVPNRNGMTSPGQEKGIRGTLIKRIFQCQYLIFCFLALIASGCQKQPGKEKMARAEKVVRQSLSSWKSGNDIKSLQSLDEPIEFYDDDWEQSAKLIEFELKQTFMESDQSARCAVILKVQYEGEEPKEVRCTYQVVDDPKIKVARDPMS